ncbi:MAG: beta-ketoacyl synthase N-terminal-like domain-containing protein [Phycisphaerae bacterium]|nr:beta-ketoacyl synthase N-terminal-like domain-containing protein [Phycisphaerae bacterium]
MHAARSRVYITGLGPISAFGVGIDPLWSALVEGRSAIRAISGWDASGFTCSAAAQLAPELYEVKTAVPKSYRKATKVMARDIEFAVGAAAEAVRDSGLVTKATEGATPTLPPDRVGCHIGAGLIAADIDELSGALATSRRADGTFDIAHWGESGMTNLTPLWLLKYLPNMLACHVTIIHDCQGPSNTITCNEASAGLSIGESMRVLQRGAADLCLSGGAETRVHPMGVLRQIFAQRLAPTPDGVDPATLVRPFDARAAGTILGEGGGILVVETEASARSRSATPIAELAGFGASQCFCSDTVGVAPENGDEIADAIDQALSEAKLTPADIDAIIPFGSGIPAIDRIESAALHRAFGTRARAMPIIQITPFVGNCGAGAGAMAVTIAAQALRTQRLPARINTIGCTELDANACASRPAALKSILVTTTSLGGQNAAIVVRALA